MVQCNTHCKIPKNIPLIQYFINISVNWDHTNYLKIEFSGFHMDLIYNENIFFWLRTINLELEI